MDNQQESYVGEWAVIEEFPRYEISRTGVIRNVITKEIKYTNKGHKLGYELVQFKKDGKTFGRKVHRLVALAFLPPPSEELVRICLSKGSGVVLVNHKDGDKLNNNCENLEWCDDGYNARHASDTGLNPSLKGEANGRAVLTEEIVHTVCKAFQLGMGPLEASITYGISRQQASKIRAGIAWKHISKLYDIKPLINRVSSTTSRKA